MSPSVFAFVSSNDSWEKIFAAKSVSFISQDNLGGIDMKNACLTPDQIKTIKPMRYCPKLVPAKAGENNRSSWVCENWVTGPYAYPRTIMMNHCQKWSQDNSQNNYCEIEDKQPVTVPQTIQVRVIQTQASYSTYPGFQKMFTFPDCK